MKTTLYATQAIRVGTREVAKDQPFEVSAAQAAGFIASGMATDKKPTKTAAKGDGAKD